MGVARARRHQPGDRSPRNSTHGLDEHLQIEAVGEAPLELTDVVARQGA
jgi:hypothetical protein